MEGLVDVGNWLDTFNTGATKLVNAATAFQSSRYTYKASSNALAAATAESNAKVAIANIEAKRAVEQAQAANANALFDFSGASNRLASFAGANQTTLLLGAAALLGVLLVMRAR